jgi:hypothetical protein
VEKMKRIKIVGLCLVAAFAFSVMVAANASAGTYEWCKPMKKAVYSDSKCEHVAEKKGKPSHKGAYEKEAVQACVAQKKSVYSDSKCEHIAEKKGKPSHKGGFEKTTGRTYTGLGGPGALSTPAFGSGKVKCSGATTAGEITGPKTDTDRVTFTGCSFEGLPCESIAPNGTPSHASGTIVTNLLDSRLIDNPETVTWVNAKENKTETTGPAVGEVWNELKSSEKEPYQVEFACGGVVYLRTIGAISGAYSPASVNVLSTTNSISYEVGVGAQGLLTEVLTEAGWAGPAPSLEEAGTTVNTNATPIEIKS